MDTNGNLNNDKVARALLQQRNTPDKECNLSPAQVLLGRQLRDTLPKLDKSRMIFENGQVRDQWHQAWSAKENAIRARLVRTCENLEPHSRELIPLMVGDKVLIQNQVRSSGRPNKWDRQGVIMATKNFDQYLVKVDGTGRLTLRNRRFLRKFGQIDTPVHPDPLKANLPQPTPRYSDGGPTYADPLDQTAGDAPAGKAADREGDMEDGDVADGNVADDDVVDSDVVDTDVADTDVSDGVTTDGGVADGDSTTRRPVGRPRKQNSSTHTDSATRGPDGRFCKQNSSSNFNVSRPGNTDVADGVVADGDSATRRPVGRPRKQQDSPTPTDSATRGPDGRFRKQNSSSNFNVSRPGNTPSAMHQQCSRQGEAEARLPRPRKSTREKRQPKQYDASAGKHVDTT
jgi:hypothetical protein